MVANRRWSPLSIIVVASFVLVLVLSIFTSFQRGRDHRAGGKKIFGAGKKVGVLEIRGPIMDSKRILEKLEWLNENRSVGGIVVRIDSPGGAVGPSQEVYEAIRKIQKPVVASLGSVAASGGYYIAVGAPMIYANPGTITGSIGVIMQFLNLEKLYEWAKVKRYSIKTGKFKDFGADYREMTADERALLQSVVDDGLRQFKSAILQSRKLTEEELDAIADGRIFTGAQARELKLVDQLGGLQEAIEEVARMAKISGKPDVVYPQLDRRKILEMLFDSQSEEEVGASITKLISILLGRHVGVSTAGFEMTPQPGLYWLWQSP